MTSAKEILDEMKKMAADLADLKCLLLADISASDLSASLNIKRHTLLAHLKSHYREGEDFYLRNNKIFVRAKNIVAIKDFYNED